MSEVQGTITYQVTLQPHWLFRAYGTVKLFATKRDKHKSQITSLKSQMEPVKKRWQDNVDKATKANQSILELRDKISSKEESIQALRRDLATIRRSGHSISLAENQKLVKYFTVDSPIAAALAYQLQAKVPWTVSPLDKLARPALRTQLSKTVEAAGPTAAQLADVRRSLEAAKTEANAATEALARTERDETPPRSGKSAVVVRHAKCLAARGGPRGTRTWDSRVRGPVRADRQARRPQFTV